ncbi:MAG: sensor histidine kinase, partial [Gaiellales bacterium]
VLISAVWAVSLGLMIPSAARDHLLDARLQLLQRVADDLNEDQLLLTGPDEVVDVEALDEVVRLRLIGGETVRVKLWSAGGTVVYSDVEQLIGRSYHLHEKALGAFDGRPTAGNADLSQQESELERGLGPLLEFYVPVTLGSGETVAVFEVYQRPDSLNKAVSGIRRNVRISIGAGLGALSLFWASFTIGNARVINRRRRQAERLVASLIRAQDEERDRIVGALHDDVGQPLYRVLYGLQGSRARVEPRSGLDLELARLETLVRGVDDTLRSELRLLHHPLVSDVGLGDALSELVQLTRDEAGLAIDLDMDGIPADLGGVAESALYRTAAEALTNVRRHADATTVKVRLHRGSNRVCLDVHDDGRGFEGVEGLGLVKARERLEALGGKLSVRARRGGGTLLSAEVPVATGRDP